jgi:hypothetical protein
VSDKLPSSCEKEQGRPVWEKQADKKKKKQQPGNGLDSFFGFSPTAILPSRFNIQALKTAPYDGVMLMSQHSGKPTTILLLCREKNQKRN